MILLTGCNSTSNEESYVLPTCIDPEATIVEEVEKVEEVEEVEEYVIEDDVDEEFSELTEDDSGDKRVFKATAYCNCSKCCGKWADGLTASGTVPTEGRTIAVDTSVIPFGTEVIINGNTYIAEDTGSAIKGDRIDIYFDSHEEALDFGVQYLEVDIK